MAASLVALLAAGPACRTTRPEDPSEASSFTVTERHFIGTPVSGPLPEANPDELGANPADAITVTCELLALRERPEVDLPPLDTATRMVLSSHTPDPVQAVLTRLVPARIGRGAAARRFLIRLRAGDFGPAVPVGSGTTSSALPPGVTWGLAVSDAGRIEIGVHYVPQATQPRTAAAAPEGDGPSGPGREGATIDVTATIDAARLEDTEAAILDPIPLADALAAPLVLLLPGPNRVAPGVTLIAVLRTEAEATGVALEEVLAGIRSTQHVSTPDEARPSRDRLEIGNAIQALGATETRRRALAFLTDVTNARLGQDLALALSPVQLAAFTERVLEEAGDVPREIEPIGWCLERAAFLHLADLSLEDTLSLELEGILLDHAGEVGHSPGLLEQAVGHAHSRDELLEQLRSENRAFLEDSSPAARVRAHDWLAARGLAPEGYDPLAPREARRAALDRVREPEEE